MLLRLQANDVGLQEHYDISFGKRLNIFTGDNGLGKSLVLDMAWWILTETWFHQPVYPRRRGSKIASITAELEGDPKHASKKTGYNPVRQTWNVTRSSNNSADMIVYAGIDGKFAVWDSLRNIGPSDVSRGPFLDGRTLHPNTYLFTEQTLRDGLDDQETGRVMCNGMIKDLVDWQLRPTEIRHAAFAYLVDVIRAISGPADVLGFADPQQLFINDVRYFPTLRFPFGTVPIIFCSAAIQRILGLAYLLVWTWTEHIRAAELMDREPGTKLVLLVDEIEAHLHPKWQRLIMEPLLITLPKILHKNLEMQLLLTTHSPLVLASIEPEFDPQRDRLYLFSTHNDSVNLQQTEWINQGDAVNWLLSPVFSLSDTRSPDAHEAIVEATKMMNSKVSPNLPQIQELNLRLTKILSDRDPFWSQWDFFRDNLPHDSI